MAQQHLRVRQLGYLTLLGLSEAHLNHLRDVLLFQIVLVQLLDTGHLIVREPIRCLGHLQLIHHLSIQLLIIDLTRIVDIQPVGNLQTDVSTATRGIRQRMGIVRRSDKRGITGSILLSTALPSWPCG